MIAQNKYYIANYDKEMDKWDLTLTDAFKTSLENDVPYEQWEPGKALPPLNLPEIQTMDSSCNIGIANLFTSMSVKELILPNWSNEACIDTEFYTFLRDTNIEKLDVKAWDNSTFFKRILSHSFFQNRNLKTIDISGITDPEIMTILFNECQLPNLTLVLVANEEMKEIVKTSLCLSNNKGVPDREVIRKAIRNAQRKNDTESIAFLRECQMCSFKKFSMLKISRTNPTVMNYFPKHKAKIHIV